MLSFPFLSFLLVVYVVAQSPPFAVNNFTDQNALVQCQPANFTWHRTSNPSASDASASFAFAISQKRESSNSWFLFSPLNSSATSFSLNIPFAAQSQVYYGLIDQDDNTFSTSQTYQIQAGDDANCLLDYTLDGQGFAATNSSSPLTFGATPVLQRTCGNLTWSWGGGTPPYSFNLAWIQDDMEVAWNVADILTTGITFILPVPKGSPYNVTISDAATNSQVNGPISGGQRVTDSSDCLLTFAATTSPPSATSSTSSSPTSPTATASSSQSSTNVGAVVGGSIAGAVVLVTGILAWIFILRKRRRDPKKESQSSLLNDKGMNSVDSNVSRRSNYLKKRDLASRTSPIQSQAQGDHHPVPTITVSLAPSSPASPTSGDSSAGSPSTSSSPPSAPTPLATKRRSIARKPPPVFEGNPA